MGEVGKQSKEKKEKATLSVLALHTHKRYLTHTTFRYQSTVKKKKKKKKKKRVYGIICLFLQITCKMILLMQQSHGQTQDLVDVTGQAAGTFTQTHISALSSCLKN